MIKGCESGLVCFLFISLYVFMGPLSSFSPSQIQRDEKFLKMFVLQLMRLSGSYAAARVILTTLRNVCNNIVK